GGIGNNVYLVVPPDSPVKSIEDLKGKKIALHRGRPWEINFGQLIQSKGLTLKDFQIVNLNPQAGAAALSAKSVDAFFTLSDALTLQ
ncbi:ABC transporter substrate-binding protein, partial [Acinetobacter nosocomialis]